MRIPKIIILICSIFVVCYSCKSNVTDTPPIAPEKMQKVLMDIHVAEYYSQGLGAQKGTFVKNFDSLKTFYYQIFDKHNIDLLTFKKSILWYQEHPVLFDTVYLRSITALDSIKQLHKNNTTNIEKSSSNDSVNTIK